MVKIFGGGKRKGTRRDIGWALLRSKITTKALFPPENECYREKFRIIEGCFDNSTQFLTKCWIGKINSLFNEIYVEIRGFENKTELCFGFSYTLG